MKSRASNLFASIVLVLMVALILGPASKVSALDTTALDQKSVLSSPGFATVDNETATEQSFIPGVNRLSYVNLSLSKMSKACDIDSKLKILSFDRSQVIGETTLNACFRPTPGTKKYDFEPDLELKLKTRYVMLLEVVTPQVWLQWHHSSGDVVKNPYSRGTAFYGTQEKEFDFNFETWGYDVTLSSPYVPPLVPENSNPATQTVPKVTASATIATPTELQGVYDAATKSVNLSWKASTTADIDGYIVGRSEDNKTFVDIGKVAKGVLLTADNTIESGKTYYYQVKAYKGLLSSVPTKSVTMVTPAAAIDDPSEVDIALSDAGTADKGLNNLEKVLLFSAGILLLLLAVLLVLTYLSKKKKVSLKEYIKSWRKR